MGFQDRETCISMFESLLHEHGLLPEGEQLDRTITNENFLALLKMAREHRDAQKAEENLRKLTRWMEQMAGSAPHYRIADSVRQRCPVCQKPTSALFNRVQSLDQQMIPVDPPRCQECMGKWVEERFPHEPLTADGSPVNPMSPSEADFFVEYEKQMGKP
jgi:hypothetical protein